MDTNSLTLPAVPPAHPSEDIETPCHQGQAWTCTLQCGPGTRGGFERLTGAKGIEACVVVQCSCEPAVPAMADGEPHLNDPTIQLVMVIFGLKWLIAP